MSAKITPDHLGRSAVVYVRQSTMARSRAISRASGDNMTSREQRERQVLHR